jgi:lipoprotein signal peptidase
MIYLFFLIFDKLFKFFLLKNNSYYSINEGLILGISFDKLLIIFFSFVVLGILLFSKRSLKKGHLGINIMICGIVMNLSDRIYWGGVIDYFSFFNILRFNFADLLILIGIFTIIYIYFIGNAKISGKSIN